MHAQGNLERQALHPHWSHLCFWLGFRCLRDTRTSHSQLVVPCSTTANMRGREKCDNGRSKPYHKVASRSTFQLDIRNYSSSANSTVIHAERSLLVVIRRKTFHATLHRLGCWPSLSLTSALASVRCLFSLVAIR
eukprot:6398513-Amphidinium_carterae.1